jgi:hypothetical protein
VVECPKDDNTKARQFTATIMNTARRSEVQAAKLPALLEAAEQRKTVALANNTRLEAAQANKTRGGGRRLTVGVGAPRRVGGGRGAPRSRGVVHECSDF